jgi:hypothetical protein
VKQTASLKNCQVGLLSKKPNNTIKRVSVRRIIELDFDLMPRRKAGQDAEAYTLN